MYFEEIPTLCFKYGTKEYVSTKNFKFDLKDLVIWTLSKPSKPLVGEIEFLGKPINVTSAAEEAGTIAVVKWNQPTCYLPGHVANMKGNKNVVPLNQLVKQGNEQFCLNVNSFHGDTTWVELIGNCVANQHGIRVHSSNQIRLGKPVIVLVDNKSISGTVEAYCTLNARAENEKYVGVKLAKSLSTLHPKVRIRHAKNGKRCRECDGDTLVFISSDILNVIGKDVLDLANIRIPSPDRSDTVVTENSEILNEEGATKPNPRVLLIGNCVVFGLELEDCIVDNIEEGSKVVAKNNEQTLHGTVLKICKIHGLEGVTSDCYAGISFDTPLGKLFPNEDTVQYKNHGGKAPSTCKCDGGRLVFINIDIFNNKNGTSLDGVVFKANEK